MSADEFPYGLEPSEVEEFRELFDLIATDESGVVGETIHLSDIPRLMELLGVGLGQAEVLQAKFKEIDYDASGDIDFEDEFLRVMSRKPSSKYSAEEAAWAFRTLAFHPTDSHTILRRDLRDAIKTYLKPPLPDMRVEELLDHAQASVEEGGEARGGGGGGGGGIIDYGAIINVLNERTSQ